MQCLSSSLPSEEEEILKSINPEIQDLAEEDIFSAAAPYLFGEGFEPKMKDRAESLKILSSAKPQQQNKQFFSREPSHCPPKRRRLKQRREVMVVQEGQTAPSDQEVTLLQDQACVGRDLHVDNINPYQCII